MFNGSGKVVVKVVSDNHTGKCTMHLFLMVVFMVEHFTSCQFQKTVCTGLCTGLNCLHVSLPILDMIKKTI